MIIIIIQIYLIYFIIKINRKFKWIQLNLYIKMNEFIIISKDITIIQK